MDIFTWLWLGWLLIFAVVEGVALANKKQDDTLSEHVWRWFGVLRKGQPDGWTRLRRFVLLSFMTWLLAHFITGGFF